MYKAKLNKNQKHLLLELLKLISETDGNVSFDEMNMIHQVMQMYNVKDYEYKNYTHYEIRDQLIEMNEDDRMNIITHSILLALSDGEFAESEQDVFKFYFDLLSLESVNRIQNMIDKYGKLEYDMRNMFYENHTEQEIVDESIKMMYDFADDDVKQLDDKSIFKMKKGPIKKVWSKVLHLWDLVKDPKNDNASKALAIGALIYLISPIDVIPDFIPFAGLTDDVGVITYAIAQLANMNKTKK